MLEVRNREPPLTLRQEKQYLYFGHLFPCTPGPFSLQYGTLSEEFPQSRPCTTRIWACTTGWRLALYLCSPSPALGLRVVAYLVTKVLDASWEGKQHQGKAMLFLLYVFVIVRQQELQ